MKIMVNLNESFIDVWNEEKKMWERYVKVSLVPEEEKKIPEKLPKSVTDNACSSKDMRLIAITLNQIIDYLKSKGE